MARINGFLNRTAKGLSMWISEEDIRNALEEDVRDVAVPEEEKEKTNSKD